VPDSNAVDQAAAQFASLLGADPPQAPQKKEDQDGEMWRGDSESDDVQHGGADRPASEQRVSRRGERRGDGGDDSEKEGEGKGTPEDVAQSSPGDAILLGMSRTAPAAVQDPAAMAGASLDNIVQQIADRILVSDPATSGGAREVRILLKESALPGTEIRILQEAGKLQVQFRTDNARVQELLLQNQSSLQTLLNERLEKHEVVVDVAMDSRGQDTNDGRSRQQRNLQEEIERQESGNPA
jgi:type III secretion system needle length determinant